MRAKELIDQLDREKHEQALEFAANTALVLQADDALRHTTESINVMMRHLVHLEELRAEVVRAVEQVRERQQSMQTALTAGEEAVERLYQTRSYVEDAGTTFRCAQDVDQVLQDMDSRLDVCVKRLGDVQARRLGAETSSNGGSSTSVMTIVQVLNEHFATLQWVGERAEALWQQTQKAKEALARLQSGPAPPRL